MRGLALGAARMIAVLLLGGLLGATLVRFAPGLDTDEEQMDVRLSHASVEAMRRSSETDTSLPRYYAHYLARLMRGDLGYSRTLNAPVKELLVERLPQTIQSVAAGLLLAWTMGLAFAMANVMMRNWVLDAWTSLCAGVLLCLPAAMLALLFMFSHAPARLVIGLIVFPKVFYYARNLMEQSASRPHVLHAWAKGLSGMRVLGGHILPPILPQLLALGGVSVSMAFAAAIPVEVICDLPGIGQLAWKAAMARDVTLLVNLTLIVTAVTLIANSGSGWLTENPRMREA